MTSDQKRNLKWKTNTALYGIASDLLDPGAREKRRPLAAGTLSSTRDHLGRRAERAVRQPAMDDGRMPWAALFSPPDPMLGTFMPAALPRLIQPSTPHPRTSLSAVLYSAVQYAVLCGQ